MERWIRRLAWGLFIWSSMLATAGVVLYFRWPSRSFAGPGGTMLEAAALVVAAVVLGAFGAALAARVPRNPIGWTFLVAAMSFGYAIFADRYIARGLVQDPGSLPLARWAALTLDATSAPGIWITILVLLFLFPTGRALSRRWGLVLLAGIFANVVNSVTTAIGPVLMPDVGHIENPLSLPPVYRVLAPIADWLWLMSAIAPVIGGISLAVRYRRSSGIERQQLKWVALSGLIAAFGGVLILVNLVVTIPLIEETKLAPALIVVGLGTIPITAGVAIFRYRLYDIDRIISRTVTYAILVALLVGVYVGLVIGLGRLIEPLTGGSDLVVAASTLIVAALFRPVLRRVQTVIERRFNRSRYDAERTIAAFTAHLRDEVDIDALGAELGEVVRRTMQPAHVSLWTRDIG